MKNSIKILHIDPDYKVMYFIFSNGSSIRSIVSLKEAITLLKNEIIDLIISEPHNRAIFTPQDERENIAPRIDHFLHHHGQPDLDLSVH